MSVCCQDVCVLVSVCVCVCVRVCAEMANIATLLRELKVNNKGTRKGLIYLGSDRQMPKRAREREREKEWWKKRKTFHWGWEKVPSFCIFWPANWSCDTNAVGEDKLTCCQLAPPLSQSHSLLQSISGTALPPVCKLPMTTILRA